MTLMPVMTFLRLIRVFVLFNKKTFKKFIIGILLPISWSKEVVKTSFSTGTSVFAENV